MAGKWRANIRQKRGTNEWSDLTYCEGMTDICKECGHKTPQAVKAWIAKAANKRRVLSSCGYYLIDVLEMPVKTPSKPKTRPVPVKQKRCYCVLVRGLLVASLLLHVVLLM